MPSVNKQLVMELARCEYIERRENVIAVGNSGTGNTHLALGWAWPPASGHVVGGLHHRRHPDPRTDEARDERRLLNLQRLLAHLYLLIINEVGFVPLSRTRAELLFEVFSQRYERGSILVTTNLPFDSGSRCSGRNASPARCWTSSPTTSISWR